MRAKRAWLGIDLSQWTRCTLGGGGGTTFGSYALPEIRLVHTQRLYGTQRKPVKGVDYLGIAHLVSAVLVETEEQNGLHFIESTTART